MKKDVESITEKGRRHFIKTSALVSFGFLAFTKCSLGDLLSINSELGADLIPDAHDYLDHPEGFEYSIISRSGDLMNDGLYVPGRPDGMGTFKAADPERVVLVRNHENSPTPLSNGAFGPENELLGKISSRVYDPGNMNSPGLGGTTTMVYNENTKQLERQHLSLAGTYRNWAGGVTPWGSWLSCEEDVTPMGSTAQKDHGFVFEVPSNSLETVHPEPIEDMGRFNHEAVAVDPSTGIVYLSEDRPDGLFYRYIP